MTVSNPKEFLSGVLFAAFGVASAIGSLAYKTGTASSMGPGYFPLVTSIGLVLLGLVVAARGVVLSGDPIPAFRWGQIAVVAGCVAGFALVTRIGVVAITIVVVIVASAVYPERRMRQAAVLAVVLAAVVTAIFIYGLKVQLPLWPIWFH